LLAGVRGLLLRPAGLGYSLTYKNFSYSKGFELSSDFEKNVQYSSVTKFERIFFEDML
jgi:hypothetical protein